MKCKIFRSPTAFEDGVTLEEQLNGFLEENPNILIENIFFTPFLFEGTTQSFFVTIFYKENESQ